MKICIAGYGLIGSIWADHYRRDGHEVTIWNRSPKDVPGFQANATDAVASVNVIHIVVSDPPAVEAFLKQITPVLSSGKLIIQSSTIDPDSAQAFESLAQSKQTLYVEAPFTGSKPVALTRQVIFFLGGTPDAKDQARNVLTSLSSRTFDLGTPTQAAALKLAMNLQIATITQALLEGLHLARSRGVPDELFFEILEYNAAYSGLAKLKKPKVLAHDFSPQFATKWMLKDLRLALNALPPDQLPATNAVAHVFQDGVNKGLGDLDFISLIQRFAPPSSPQT
jgi:3-hydroxyisobutyrate dehydrogenase-like beta-hydroxyacid dehydrogenase